MLVHVMEAVKTGVVIGASGAINRGLAKYTGKLVVGQTAAEFIQPIVAIGLGISLPAATPLGDTAKALLAQGGIHAMASATAGAVSAAFGTKD